MTTKRSLQPWIKETLAECRARNIEIGKVRFRDVPLEKLSKQDLMLIITYEALRKRESTPLLH